MNKTKEIVPPVDTIAGKILSHRIVSTSFNLKCVLCVKISAQQRPCADLNNYTRGSFLICLYFGLFHRACFGQERTKLCIPIQNLTYGSQR